MKEIEDAFFLHQQHGLEPLSEVGFIQFVLGDLKRVTLSCHRVGWNLVGPRCGRKKI